MTLTCGGDAPQCFWGSSLGFSIGALCLCLCYTEKLGQKTKRTEHFLTRIGAGGKRRRRKNELLTKRTSVFLVPKLRNAYYTLRSGRKSMQAAVWPWKRLAKRKSKLANKCHVHYMVGVQNEYRWVMIIHTVGGGYPTILRNSMYLAQNQTIMSYFK